MEMRLARAILFAKDVTRLAGFYRNALGLRELPSELPPEEWTVLDAGGAELALHRVPDPWNAGIELRDPPSVRHGSPHKLVFFVEDVGKARDALIARGVAPVAPERSDAAAALGRCDFVDPEGNVFQIAARGA